MKGWLSVAVVVLGYDSWAAVKTQPTLSSQFKGATDAHPVAVAVATTYLVMHLWGLWPRKVDPFCGFCWLVGYIAH